MKHFTRLATPLLLLAAAVTASAQDVPYTVFREGAFAPSQALTGQKLIKSEAQLRQAGLERLMPVGGSFDFGQESLVALVMPQQSKGGVSIGVRSIQLRMSGSQPTLEVKYGVSRPAPGAPVTKVVTRPYALVRIAATTLRASFIDTSATGGGGGLLPPGQMPFHVVNAGSQAGAGLPSGNVFVKSAAELASSGLASLVPNASAIRWDLEQLGILVMDPQTSGGTSIAVKRVRRQITPFTGPGGAAGGAMHYAVQYEVLRPSPGGAATTVMTRPFQVVRFSRGQAVFEDLSPAPTPLLPPGQLPFHVVSEGTQAPFGLTGSEFVIRSASELSAQGLSALVPNVSAIRWDVEMLVIVLSDVQTKGGYGVGVKKVLQRMTPFTGPGGSIGGAHRHLVVQYEKSSPGPGFGTTVINRPFQVVRLSKSNRVVFEELNAAPTPPPAPTGTSGVVRVQRMFGISIVSLQQGSRRLYLTPRSFAQSLAPLEGQRVTIDADQNPNVSSVLSARGLIAPEVFAGQGVVRGSASAPTFVHQGQSLRLEGRLAESLGAHAQGLLVQGVEGFRFEDGRLLVTQFRATTRHPATVTLSGTRVNRLQSGEAVTVVGRSRSGRSLVVEPAQGASGYVTTWRLRLGNSPVLMTPGAPSAGVSGTLGGASGQ